MKKRSVFATISSFLVIVLLFSLLTPSAFAADEIVQVGSTPEGGAVYQIDAAVQAGDKYTSITGFSVEVTMTEMGSFSGAMPMSVLLATKGAHDGSEYVFTYPDNFPVYDLADDEIVAMAVGANAFIGPMAFKNGKAMEEDFAEGDTRTLTYEGNVALFSDDSSVMTLVCFTGQFTINSIKWIYSDVSAADETPWEKVEKTEFLDIETVTSEKQNGYNYVDITIPATGEDSYPVIFWIHGGGWASMSRKSCILDDTKEFLLSQGYAFVSAEYTLCERTEEGGVISPKMQMLYDLKAAVRFLRANAETYKLNTNYIVAMGESAGAHLALLMGTTNGRTLHEDLSMGNAAYSGDVSAAVSYFGPSYFVADENASEADITMAYALLGDEVMTFSDEIMELEKNMSPSLLVSETTVPLFITHSKLDGTVPVSHSERMIEAAGAYLDADDLQSIIYETGGHGDRSVFDTNAAYTAVAKFINAHRPDAVQSENSAAAEKPSVRSIILIAALCAVVLIVVIVVCVRRAKAKKK